MLLGRGSGSPAPCSYFPKPLSMGRKREVAVIKLGKDPIPTSHLCCSARQEACHKAPGGKKSRLQPPYPDLTASQGQR